MSEALEGPVVDGSGVTASWSFGFAGGSDNDDDVVESAWL